MGSQLMPDPYLDLTEFDLIPGPVQLSEPAYSFDINEVELYPPALIEEAYLAVPGVRLLHPAFSVWRNWKARWENEDRYIEFDIRDWDVDPADCNGLTSVWEGSSLLIHCRLSDLLDFWQAVRRWCPGVWLHDTSTRMWSPQSFAKEYARGSQPDCKG